MAATKVKPPVAADFKLTAQEEQLLERLARIVRRFREIDPDYMNAARMELFIQTALHPDRSLKAHALALGMGTLNVHRNGAAWAARNTRNDPGYDRMVEGERPFFEEPDSIDKKAAELDWRSGRRKYMALNKEGVKLLDEILLLAKG